MLAERGPTMNDKSSISGGRERVSPGGQRGQRGQPSSPCCGAIARRSDRTAMYAYNLNINLDEVNVEPLDDGHGAFHQSLSAVLGRIAPLVAMVPGSKPEDRVRRLGAAINVVLDTLEELTGMADTARLPALIERIADLAVTGNNVEVQDRCRRRPARRQAAAPRRGRPAGRVRARPHLDAAGGVAGGREHAATVARAAAAPRVERRNVRGTRNDAPARPASDRGHGAGQHNRQSPVAGRRPVSGARGGRNTSAPATTLPISTGDYLPATGDRRPATGDRRPATGDR